MQKVKDINEAIAYLRDGDILTKNGKDMFAFKNDRVYRYDNGTKFSLTLEDFYSLYKNNDFYLYEEAIEIDDQKDEDYYRYYKK